MERVLMLMTMQGAMGAFDAIYHHEITERLAWRLGAARELAIHTVRNGFYAALYLAFAWAEWHGLWAVGFAAIVVSEIFVTLLDFVTEDRSRDLPATERITHTLLAINFGVILAVLLPEFWRWAPMPTEVVPVSHGVWSWIATGIGILTLLVVVGIIAAYGALIARLMSDPNFRGFPRQ